MLCTKPTGLARVLDQKICRQSLVEWRGNGSRQLQRSFVRNPRYAVDWQLNKLKKHLPQTARISENAISTVLYWNVKFYRSCYIHWEIGGAQGKEWSILLVSFIQNLKSNHGLQEQTMKPNQSSRYALAFSMKMCLSLPQRFVGALTITRK